MEIRKGTQSNWLVIMCKDTNLISSVKGKGKFQPMYPEKTPRKEFEIGPHIQKITFALNSENHRCKSVITTSRSNNHSYIHHQSLIIVVSITN